MNSQKVWRTHATYRVLVDFDGTIAPDDPTDRLFERFADPVWRKIEEAWQSGQISSRECMERQVELLRATPAEIDEEIRKFRIDPAFHTFLKYCRCRGLEVFVVSDGFDRVLRAVLKNAHLAVPFFANRLERQGADRWRLGFPFSRSGCRAGSANCKCSHGAGRYRSTVAIGDGRSDFCMAMRADFVIAKGTLAGFCRSHGLAHQSFSDFDDATMHLSKWLAADELQARASVTTAGGGREEPIPEAQILISDRPRPVT
jgi:2-hydroxy-3-keto-5-methylthiopentenyl-1-phosphate phosphatase